LAVDAAHLQEARRVVSQLVRLPEERERLLQLGPRVRLPRRQERLRLLAEPQLGEPRLDVLDLGPGRLSPEQRLAALDGLVDPAAVRDLDGQRELLGAVRGAGDLGPAWRRAGQDDEDRMPETDGRHAHSSRDRTRSGAEGASDVVGAPSPSTARPWRA